MKDIKRVIRLLLVNLLDILLNPRKMLRRKEDSGVFYVGITRDISFDPKISDEKV